MIRKIVCFVCDDTIATEVDVWSTISPCDVQNVTLKDGTRPVSGTPVVCTKCGSYDYRVKHYEETECNPS